MPFQTKVLDKSAKDDERPCKLGCNAPAHLSLTSPYYAGNSPEKNYKRKKEDARD